MSSTFDYKWRKRMCHKWQEEQREQQRQQQFPQPLVRPATCTVACKSLRTFADDPMNLHKLFLSRRTVQLLLKQRTDFQRLVKGCFVRVKFGAGYSVAQIQGLGKWQPSSSMEPALILRIDHNPRVFALQHLANSYYEPRELLEWELMWQSCNFELPSKSLVEQKYKLLTEAKLQLQAQDMQQTTCITHKLATPTQCSQSCLPHALAAPSGGRHCHRSHPPQQQPPSSPPGEWTFLSVLICPSHCPFPCHTPSHFLSYSLSLSLSLSCSPLPAKLPLGAVQTIWQKDNLSP